MSKFCFCKWYAIAVLRFVYNSLRGGSESKQCFWQSCRVN